MVLCSLDILGLFTPRISPHHLREVGCVALTPEDLDVEVDATFQQSSNQLEETLIPPGKEGVKERGSRIYVRIR